MKKHLTYSVSELKAPDSKGLFEAYVAQTWPEDTDRKNFDKDGDIFTVGAFDAQDGEEVPVFYAHDYSPTSEVGRATLYPTKSREVLPATGRLFVGEGKPMAEGVYESMLLPSDNPNSLKEFSVGFEYSAGDVTKRADGLRVIHKAKVAEVSVVYAGAQQTELVAIKLGRTISKANEVRLKEARDIIDAVLSAIGGDDGKGVELEIKRAIPSHSTDTYGGSWDGPAQEAKIPNDAGASVFRKMFAWVDAEGDPDIKSSYKFIHHTYSGGPGPASTTAASAGIGVLNGGRGGTTIPQADVQGVYNHLASHLRDANLEPPPLKSAPDPRIDEMRRRLEIATAGF